MIEQPLKILVCGGNTGSLDDMAKVLAEEGVMVKTTTRLIDSLCFSHQEWDVLLIDLDGLNSFLTSLLPVVRRRFTRLYMVGISTQSAHDISFLSCYGIKFDDYLFDLPHPEDLIVRLPQLAASCLYDIGAL
jgi:hypothetical protein